MKLLLIKVPSFLYGEFLTINKWYEGAPATTKYDPQTLKPSSPEYVIRCDDERYRMVGCEYFLTEGEWRERKLNELGI